MNLVGHTIRTLAIAILAIACYLLYYPMAGASGLMLIGFVISMAEIYWMLFAAIGFGLLATTLQRLGEWLEAKI